MNAFSSSIVQRARSSNVTATGFVVALAVLVFFATAMGAGDSSAQSVVLVVFYFIVGWLALRSPAHLVLVSVITASTVPAIIFGPILTLVGGGYSFNLRSEYLLFAILFGFFLLRKTQTRLRASLDIPVVLFVVIQLLSVMSGLLRGDLEYIGLGPVIRLIEGYSFYFLASRLTSRKQISGLVWVLTAIGGLVALAIIVTSITGSQELYINLFSGTTDPEDVRRSNFYAQFFLGYESPRVGFTEGEPLLLITLALSVVMLFQVGWQRLWYSVPAFLVALRMLISGQRFQIGFLIATLFLSVALAFRRPAERRKRAQLRFWIVLGLLSFALITLMSSGEWATKWEVMGIRSEGTLEGLISLEQTLGIRLAWSELLDNPSAWVAGFSPFHYSIPMDINLGFLLTVYYYGLGGLIVLLWLLGASVVQALRLLRSRLIPEERALVYAVVIFIAIYVANGFVRNMVFNEAGRSVIVFSICLGWLQVIWHDMQGRDVVVRVQRR